MDVIPPSDWLIEVDRVHFLRFRPRADSWHPSTIRVSHHVHFLSSAMYPTDRVTILTSLSTSRLVPTKTVVLPSRSYY